MSDDSADIAAMRWGDVLDLGHDHVLRFSCWRPDRELNPQYEGVPDVDGFGATITHRKPNGEGCIGSITFEGAVQNRLEPDRPKWRVESWRPLTVTPSLLCQCGDHGFITEGKWVPA